MTTTVKVITHSWPVQVTTTDHGADGQDHRSESRVEPDSEREFHIHSTRSLSFKELPEDQKSAAEPASETSTGEGV
jgi:hypothetical protein